MRAIPGFFAGKCPGNAYTDKAIFGKFFKVTADQDKQAPIHQRCDLFHFRAATPRRLSIHDALRRA